MTSIDTTRLAPVAAVLLGLFGLNAAYAQQAPPADATPPPAEAAPKSEEKELSSDPGVLGKEAFDLYKEGDYERALKRYERVASMVEDPRPLYMAGRCLESLKRLTDALDVYTRVLAQEPDADLARRISTRITDIRKTLASWARLQLDVQPAGATVRVDGRDVGTSPVGTLTLEPGKHTVSVSAPGHRPAVRDVELEVGDTQRLAIGLTPLERETIAHPWYKNPWGWSAAGGGIVSIVVGGILMGVAESDRDRVRSAQIDAEAAGELVTGITMVKAHDLEEGANTKSAVGATMLVVGWASLAGGAVLFVLDAMASPGSPEPAGQTISVTPMAGGALLRAEFLF